MNDFDCGRFVARRIKQLLGDNPAQPTPWARAMLAQLRQAAAQAPGTAPAVWPITTEGLPELPAAQLDRVEWAVHTALTQFAVHQQSRAQAMNDPHQAFGRAIRMLAMASTPPDGEPYDTPVYRRFTAMSMATTQAGLLAHSRSLISQLRAHDIPFDYGQYARDLSWFQVPGQSSAVQRRWGRDFHQLSSTLTNSQEGLH